MEILVQGQIDQNTKNVLVLLHGFPGITTQQNRDLAPHFFEKLGWPTVIVFYPGLSMNPGKFTYTETYSLVKTTLNDLLAKNPHLKINLYGHSFGGYLSLRLAKDFNKNIGKIFLLSPLLHVIDKAFFTELINKLYTEQSYLDRHPLEYMYENHQQFVADYDPKDLKVFLSSKKVMLYQARLDTITPTAIAKDYVKDTNIKYEESEQEHSFLTDRTEVLNKALEFYQQT
jgi:pimeloyl-ACP methyl ester carboxylesterase